MDIKKRFLKLLSPDTYTERGVFIALGIYCIDRALFLLANSYNTYLRISLAVFSIAIGVIVLVKFGKRFKGDTFRQGLDGLGIWLILNGLLILLPAVERLFVFEMAFSFGAGTVLMIGVMKRGSVKKEMGLFLLGLYLLFVVVFQMMPIFGIRGYFFYDYRFFGIALPLILIVSGVFLIFRCSDESIIADDIQKDTSNIK